MCVTGVSGSGKSTLVNDTLYHATARHLYGSSAEPAPHQSLEGLAFFDKVINMDQSPIGRTPALTRLHIPAFLPRSESYLQGCSRHESAAMHQDDSHSTLKGVAAKAAKEMA